MSLNGGYAMIKYNSTQEELQIAYRSKKPVLCYDENRRAHWAVIEETATESVDEETQEPITIYEYSYRLIDEASGSEVHLYRHHILLGGYVSSLDSYPLYVAFDIYLSTDTPLTFNGVISWLHGNGYNIGKHLFTVVSDESSAPLENVGTHIIIGLYAQSTRIYTQIQYVDGANVGKLGGGFINSSQSCEDTVTQIF